MRPDEVELWQEMGYWKAVQESIVTVMAVTHFFKDIWIENIDGENDLPLWDHVLL